MRSVINEDAKVMKRNSVRSVSVTEESGAIQNKMSFNKEGRVTNFSSYEYNEGEEISYEIQWSEDSKIQKIFYKEFGKTAMSFVYDFYYKESLLDYISVDFGLGLSENYIFAYGENIGEISIEKISYKYNYKDTVYMEQHLQGVAFGVTLRWVVLFPCSGRHQGGVAGSSLQCNLHGTLIELGIARLVGSIEYQRKTRARLAAAYLQFSDQQLIEQLAVQRGAERWLATFDRGLPVRAQGGNEKDGRNQARQKQHRIIIIHLHLSLHPCLNCPKLKSLE